jgi:hypothetical protein
MYGQNAGAAAGMGALWVLWLALAVFGIVCLWKIFAKAGQPGWAAVIPIYNTYVLLKVASKPGWWLILFFVPLVNLVIMILADIGLAKNFGPGAGFAVGLILLPIIFLPILAFGSATYRAGAPGA